MMKKSLKMISVVLTVILLLTVFVTPVAARQRGDRGESRGRGRQNAREIQYLDAEVQLINGQLVLRYETEKGYVNIPFDMHFYALSDDGQEFPLKRQDDAILLPTEDGFEAVALEDFSVVMIDGQLMLFTEVNPVWLIPIKAAVIAALKMAGVTITTASLYVAGKLMLAGVAITRFIHFSLGKYYSMQ